jgi:hypothetical protein
MQQVPTVGNVTWNSRCVYVFEAHRTIGTRNIFDALQMVKTNDQKSRKRTSEFPITHPMTINFQLQRQAHVAHLTVEEPPFATHPTNAASIAMVLVFVLIVEQVANQTAILFLFMGKMVRANIESVGIGSKFHLVGRRVGQYLLSRIRLRTMGFQLVLTDNG